MSMEVCGAASAASAASCRSQFQPLQLGYQPVRAAGDKIGRDSVFSASLSHQKHAQQDQAESQELLFGQRLLEKQP